MSTLIYIITVVQINKIYVPKNSNPKFSLNISLGAQMNHLKRQFFWVPTTYVLIEN